MTKVPITSDDCFGQEYDLTAKECTLCHAAAHCASVYAKAIKAPKVASAEKKEGPFLDQVTFLTPVQKEKVKATIQSCQDAGEPITTEEIFDYFLKRMNTKDDEIVINALKEFKAEYGITSKEGLMYVK